MRTGGVGAANVHGADGDGVLGGRQSAVLDTEGPASSAYGRVAGGAPRHGGGYRFGGGAREERERPWASSAFHASLRTASV